MNIRSWIDLKTYLCKLIKQISLVNGGDDETWLSAYCEDVIKLYRNELKVPIECFERLIQQAKDCGWMRQNGNVLTRSTGAGSSPLTGK